MKKKIAFALMMGVITTGLISFTVISINVGFIKNFVFVWLKSWFIGYFVVVPIILFVAPKVQSLVDRIFDDRMLIKEE